MKKRKRFSFLQVFRAGTVWAFEPRLFLQHGGLRICECKSLKNKEKERGQSIKT